MQSTMGMHPNALCGTASKAPRAHAWLGVACGSVIWRCVSGLGAVTVVAVGGLGDALTAGWAAAAALRLGGSYGAAAGGA